VNTGYSSEVCVDWAVTLSSAAGRKNDETAGMVHLPGVAGGRSDRDADILHFFRSLEGVERLATGSLAEQDQASTILSDHLHGGTDDWFHIWSRAWMGGCVQIFAKEVREKSSLMAADAAIAIELHRLQHGGRLPASLDELVPGYFESVPLEPRSNEPFELIVPTNGNGVGRGVPLLRVRMNGTLQ